MEATIRIDGRDVRFRSTAATPLLYRQEFNRDLLRDLESLAEEMHGAADGKADLPVRVLTTFERMAYIMAKQAAPDTVPNTPEEWLDGFSIMPFYAIMPMLLDLWSGNVTGLEESKKKSGAVDRDITTALLLLRAVRLGLSLGDLDRLTIGMLNDMYAEAENDTLDWPTLATQEDMDRML